MMTYKKKRKKMGYWANGLLRLLMRIGVDAENKAI